MPVSLSKSNEGKDSYAELILYQNRIQLSTYDALYSDGVKYIPACVVIDNIGREVSGIKSVLILGAGLASMVQVLHKAKVKPNITLVDINPVILDWVSDYLNIANIQSVDTVCTDARQYMLTNHNKFDLIFVDIFIGKVVPDFVLNKEFLKSCKNSLNPGGFFSMNYIERSVKETWELKSTIQELFPDGKITVIGLNLIFVNKV